MESRSETLWSALTSKFDLITHRAWTNRLIASANQAMELTPICLALIHNFSSGGKSLADHQMSEDQKILNQLSAFLEKALNHILNGFWTKAAEESKEMCGRADSHRKCVDTLYAHLTRKYQWRKWLVTAWSSRVMTDTASPFAFHTSSKSGIFRLRSRVLLVASTNRMVSDIKQKTDRCLRPHNEENTFCGTALGGATQSELIKDHLSACLRKYESIVVVHEGKGKSKHRLNY